MSERRPSHVSFRLLSPHQAQEAHLVPPGRAGAGVLALPQSLGWLGWVAGPILLITFYITSLISSWCVSEWVGASLGLSDGDGGTRARGLSPPVRGSLAITPTSPTLATRLLADCYEVDGVENGRYHDIVKHILVSRTDLTDPRGDVAGHHA